jgi:hypothetical protein
MMKRILIFLAASCSCFIAFSQKNIQGYISDRQTSEKLIGCSVHIAGTTEGVFSNNYGFFSIKSNLFPVSLVFSYLGYISDTISFSASNENVNILLSSRISDLREIEIRVSSNDVETPKIGVLEIPMKQLRLLPAIGGEVDVLKAFQLMPGVQGGTEGTSGLYVRGGTPDQNLILLDDIPLYYVNHIGGFVSIFDINAINDVKLIKGGFPARYGGRLSSVVDIRMKSGNAELIKGQFEIGIIASKFFLEGPLINKKNRFMISARRCNLDLGSRLITIMGSGNQYNAGYTFYDVYTKVTHDFNPRNSLSLSFYNGHDNIFFNQKDKIAAFGSNTLYDYQAKNKWGNTLASLKWNHQYTSKLFGSLTLAYTHFNYTNQVKYEMKDKTSRDVLERASTSFISGVNDLILKKDFDYYVTNNVSLKIGTSFTHHQFNPGLNIYKDSSKDTTIGSTRLTSDEIIIYTESELTLTKKLNANIGLHYNSYWVNNHSFPSLQPRVTVNYIIKQDWSVKASYVFMQQNLHLLSNNGAGLPTDLWVPATSTTRPQYSHLYSIGVYHTLENSGIEINIEGYYKTLNNQIEFSEGASFFGGANNWEDKIERDGKGKSYGIELLIQKKQGRLTGWIGYTLSYNYRKFQYINEGDWYPYKFDRRHYLTLVANYSIKKHVIVSSDFVFNTGNAITLPDSKYPSINNDYNNVSNNPISVFTQTFDNIYTYPGRNQSRMPVYHRLDVSVHFTKEKQKGTREWVISIYNVYCRQNPYFVYLDFDSGNNLHLYQISLFPIIPSISYIRSF